MEVSRHKCLIYEGHPSEQLPVVIPFLLDGLQNRWRCLYLGSPNMVDMVQGALASHGVNPHRESHLGTLVLSSDRDYLVRGIFEPEKMIDGLNDMVDRAVADGYEGLCATGDMAWELGTEENFDRLLEYEARLEEVLREKPIRGICQYHRELVPAHAVQDAFTTHRSAYVGSVLNDDNIFYMPPELLLEKGASADSRQSDWMCRQIIRIVAAEQTRDQALKALKESEAQLTLLAQQLAEANRSLERRVQRRTVELETANRQLASFSYSVSHDLRQPLQSIVGFSEILGEQFGDVLGPKGRQHLGRVQSGAERIEELIDAYLKLSGAARSELHQDSVDVTSLAHEVARELQEREPHRAAEFVIHPGMRARADHALLRAALCNLMGNAWKFTSKTPAARIEIGKIVDNAASIHFFVRDNGAGFDMASAHNLFVTFERLHKQTDFPGTGIGLATVHRIITRHGGRIWAEGRPNQGATFFFTLPDDASDSSDSAEHSAASPSGVLNLA